MNHGGKNNMKILVTGARGQLGKKIIDILKTEHQLILTDVHNMDITDLETIRNIIKKEIPDYIIHTAAYTQVDKAEEEIELCRKINSYGTRNMAILSKEYNIKLIYISTDFVFDGKKTSPYSEDDIANPISVYGLTKYEGEEFIRLICEKYYILRVSWLFGELPEEYSGTNFIETILKLSKDKRNLSVVNDQIGSPTYTGDLIQIIAEIIKKTPEFGIYNFSGKGECSWYDFAKEIFKQTNTSVDLKPIKSFQYPQKANRPAYSYLDKLKIENNLKIKVRSWQEMLSEYLAKKFDK
jgi:dTDP-4-dehydrorhamnose reductase